MCILEKIDLETLTTVNAETFRIIIGIEQPVIHVVHTLLINDLDIIADLLPDAFKHCRYLGRETIIICKHPFLIIGIRPYYGNLLQFLSVQRKQSSFILKKNYGLAGHLQSVVQMLLTLKHRQRNIRIWNAAVQVEHSQTQTYLKQLSDS